MLPGFPVTAGMAFRTAFIAFATCLSAEIAHVAFRSFFVEDPFQSGKTVTDKSRDPNGTLLTGLRTTKMPLTQVNPVLDKPESE